MQPVPATFLLGGSICTRSCAFCQVDKGRAPEAVNPEEGERVAEAVLRMGTPLRGPHGRSPR